MGPRLALVSAVGVFLSNCFLRQGWCASSPPSPASDAPRGIQVTLVTWAGTTYGGWGDEFLQKHVKPEFAVRLRAEKRAGGSGFETIKWKQRLYQDMNIEIARANYRMLMERFHRGWRELDRIGALDYSARPHGRYRGARRAMGPRVTMPLSTLAHALKLRVSILVVTSLELFGASIKLIGSSPSAIGSSTSC